MGVRRGSLRLGPATAHPRAARPSRGREPEQIPDLSRAPTL